MHFIDNLSVLRAPSWISFPPRVFLRGPSRTPFESFPTPWSPFADSSFALLTDPLSPLVEIFSPFPTFGGSLLSLLQPLSGPSDPFRVLSNPWSPFADFFCPARSFPLVEIFSPCPTFGGSFLSLLQPLRGPSPFFVALRGYLFAFSWKSFLPLATFGGSLLSLLQPLRAPSWITLFPFVLFVEPLCGFLSCPSWITPQPVSKKHPSRTRCLSKNCQARQCLCRGDGPAPGMVVFERFCRERQPAKY